MEKEFKLCQVEAQVDIYLGSMQYTFKGECELSWEWGMAFRVS